MPEFSLPPYTYTPGRTPHPISDPDGHSFGRHESPVARFEPARWTECEPYVRGIRLFNRGYYWEAHEAWEAVWHAVGRSGAIGDFLKGLIKWAAAGVKLREGRPAGAMRHLHRATELLRSARGAVAAPDHVAGQDIGKLLTRLDSVRLKRLDAPAAKDGGPAVFWEGMLREP